MSAVDLIATFKTALVPGQSGVLLTITPGVEWT